ncbi:MAG TPA: cytochrome c3 family protein, partial [Bacteroidota bacterium]|nr:cytochrome c3 family protein [Bacteroidota bacterium]
MLGTKHNLSVSGTGAIRASSEQQVCVFCHTPHLPKQFAAEQLWNHQASTSEYSLYSSDYLTNINYSAPSQPNARSKLCLSCHDGTVAIGAVYNNGGPQTIAMQNDVTTMPPQAAGDIGTSLANDHPVGYPYDNTRDPELVARPFPWQTPVRLDPDASNGTVECITCHEPHDNSNTKFLRVANANAALCTFCHSKTGWSDAIHRNSTQSYTPPGISATTIGDWACRSCHQSHGGEGAPYLLIGHEENTCFGSGCHGSIQTGPSTKNIQSEFEKLYKHPTVSVIGKHKNPDD